MSNGKKWEVLINIQVTLHVEAPDESGAEALAHDALSRLSALPRWKGIVTLADDWRDLESITELTDGELTGNGADVIVVAGAAGTRLMREGSEG
jgi:hypothetical protein